MTKEQEILNFLNKNVFSPILNSDTASQKLKIGARQTKMKMRHKDASGMILFFWSSIAGTSRSKSFAVQMKKEGFVRFEEVMDEFRLKFNDEWLRNVN
ncbi:MAG: hypothetical protein HOP31_06125 [Ignavibacteria bacterium]|nr:hypothetical protein [Ignavibacteria bacterium]